MGDLYSLTGDLTLLATELGQALRKKHDSMQLVDKTIFVSRDSFCRMDTYAVFYFNLDAYITINLYYFRPDISEDSFQVKTHIFPNNAYGKTQKIRNEIKTFLSAHGGIAVSPEQ